MTHFYLETPSLNRKQEIIDYINELVIHNSDLNGIEVLTKILDGYTFEQTLERCLNLENKEYAQKLGKAQAKTFLLIRKEDDKIIGALNIRWNLPKEAQQFGGNMGYGIRPTERRKGYNKINLYLGLREAQKIGLEKVKLVCETNNIGSVKTIEALGGTLEQTTIDPSDGLLTSIYSFNVKQTLEEYKESFRNNIDTNNYIDDKNESELI